MIPISLSLKNFLSYGPDLQTIDFSPYNLICLSGKNGHGKSALLDAITWSIWGVARKVQAFAKPDQGLLRLGQSHMLVIFDFEFNTNRYRIRREFTQSSTKNYAQLEFGIIDQKTGCYSPLTDKTSRATQQVINQTLALTFDTFCNSAFIRQGQANEFSKKSPKERKEILTTILGLDQYDQVRAGALEKIKQHSFAINGIKALQIKRAQELLALPNLLQQSAEIDNLINSIDNEINQKNECIIQNKEKITQLEQSVQKKRILEIKHEQISQIISNDSKKLNELIFSYRKTIHEFNKISDLQLLFTQKNLLSDKRDSIECLTQEHVKNQQKLLFLQKELNKIELEDKAEKEIKIGELLVMQEQQRMTITQLKQETVLNKNSSLKNQAELALLEQSTETTKQEIIILKKNSEYLTVLQIQFEKRKGCYHRLVQKLELLKKDLTQIGQKTGLVEIDNPSCPLCEQNLSAARKRFLKNKFEDQHLLLFNRHARITKVLQKLKLLLIEQHKIIMQLNTEQNQLSAKELQIAQLKDKQKKVKEKLHADFLQATELEQQLITTTNNQSTVEKNLYALKKTLNIIQDKNYLEIKQEYEFLYTLVTNNAINENLTEIRTELQKIELYIQTHQEIIRQMTHQASTKKQITLACTSLRKSKKERLVILESLHKLSQVTHHQEKLIELEQLYSQNLLILHTKKNELLLTKGSFIQAINQMNILEREQREEKINLENLMQTIEDFQLISHMVGKDGIPALLIEQTVPIIEFEANQLLAKLTNNQSQIFFESLRDLKQGGTKETLEIKIADNVGIRPYELFSGGEAFRVDFAIRIAISKLLAQRAGTALQTLIIDEGFGSQDEEGLSCIMDSLYKIQDDFAKIIIVSHLPFMKDNFPVHFWIEKGSTGSKVSILELG